MVETREMKRRRLSKETENLARAHPTKWSWTCGPLYFDTLPDDVVTLLVKYLSRCPHSKYWQRHLDWGIAYEALRCGGAVTRTARTLFTDLACTRSEDQFLPRPTNTGIQRYSDISEHSYLDVLVAQAPRIQALPLKARRRRDHRYGYWFESCSQLRVLVFKDKRVLKSISKSTTGRAQMSLEQCYLHAAKFFVSYKLRTLVYPRTSSTA